jgi:hypothetical protein
MNNPKPLFDPATHYRIEVLGRVDVEWLQSFGGQAEAIVDTTMLTEVITVLNVKTDQSGVVGLVRRLHGLGIAILRIQIVSDGRKAAQNEEQR